MDYRGVIDMTYLSLYRKYRPGGFEDLVGQNYVVKTLKNALKNDRIAHAYLFAGPRGTGKTSTAKVYARALNCQEEETLEPCGECENCKKITSGQSIDVIEIDAASNRGIDEIRELREKVKFYPSEGQYKVYIIDEVHMLTKGAFNALLKTLEEPPENVVFILATTEPHRVIPTIMSRCQRFDFSLLSVSDIEERLRYICVEEDVSYEREALNLISHTSNGGLRDAISILDQAISFTDGNITIDRLRDMLGKIDISVLQQFIQDLAEEDSTDALELVNQLINKGKGVSRFVSDLIEHCRYLLLIKECGMDTELIDFPPSRRKILKKESQLLTVSRLTGVIEVLTDIERDLKFSNQSRLILEMGIVKLTSPTEDSSLSDLETRISELENRLNHLKSLDQSEGDKNAGRVENKIEKEQNKINNEITYKQKIMNQKKEKEKSSDISTTKKIDKNNNKPKTNKNNDQELKSDKKELNEESSPEGTSPDKKNMAGFSPEGGEGDLTIDQIRKSWPAILSNLKKEDIKTHAFLVEGKPIQVEGNVVYIQFGENKNFHKKGAAKNKRLIKNIVGDVLNQSCHVEFISTGDNIENSGSANELAEENSKKKLKNDELVDRVVEMFDGKVIEAREDILEN